MPPKTVNVVPLLDPSVRVQPIEMKVDPRSTFSEIVWRLGRLRDRHGGRITPGRRPFFYRLPISVNEYHTDFKLHPIDDFRAVFNHNIYVLLDKPGRVFIQSESRNLTFHNIWMPKDTLIFKGTFFSPYFPLALTSTQTSSAHCWGKGPLGWTSKSSRTYASRAHREPKCLTHFTAS